jgi:hypothetical protein
MANETELANIKHQTDVISDAISAALVQGVVFAPLIYGEDLPPAKTTNVKLFRKAGSFTAETITESTAHAVDAAGQELTETSVTATAAKYCANTMITVEAEKFSPITKDKIYAALGNALARWWDGLILALFSGFTGNTAITASSVLTVEDVLQAAYSVRAGTYGVAPASGLICGLDYKGVYELQKQLVQSSASVFGVPSQISLLSGLPGTNGYSGELPGVRIYAGSGLPTSSSDDVGVVFDPAIAFCSMMSPTPDYYERWIGGSDGTRGYATEYSAILYGAVAEWNDLAGCCVKSDT